MVVLSEIPCSAIASLIEVGVGVNLALALLDDFRNTLKTYSERFVDYSTGYYENLFLPLLESSNSTGGTDASGEAASKAVSYMRTLQTVSSIFTSKAWFITLKFVSLAIAIALTILLAITPFLGASYVLSVEKVLLLWGVCLFPFLIALLQTIVMVPVLFILYLRGKYIELTNKALIVHMKQLKDKPIP